MLLNNVQSRIPISIQKLQSLKMQTLLKRMYKDILYCKKLYNFNKINVGGINLEMLNINS